MPATAPTMPESPDSSCDADTRVDEPVENVDDEVDHDVDARDEERDAGDRREVERDRRSEGIAAETGVREDRLDEDRAGENVGEGEPEHGDHRGRRSTQD